MQLHNFVPESRMLCASVTLIEVIELASPRVNCLQDWDESTSDKHIRTTVKIPGSGLHMKHGS